MKIFAKYEYPTGKKGEIIEIFIDKEGRERFKKIEEDSEGDSEENTCPIGNFFRFFNFKFTEISLEFHNFLRCKVAKYLIDMGHIKKEIEEDEKAILALQNKIEDSKNRIKIMEIVSKQINERLEEVNNGK